MTDDKGTTTTTETPADAAPDPAPTRTRTRTRNSSPADPPVATTTEPPAGEQTEPPEPPNDKPPRKVRKPRSDRGRSRTARSPRDATPAALRKGLAQIISTVGGLVMFIDAYDGQVIAQNAEPLADGWAKVAERHPRVRGALGAFENGGVYGAAIIATVTVAMPILAHHRMLPPRALDAMAMAGVPVPAASPASGTGREPRREPVTRTGPPPPTSGAPVGETASPGFPAAAPAVG